MRELAIQKMILRSTSIGLRQAQQQAVLHQPVYLIDMMT